MSHTKYTLSLENLRISSRHYDGPIPKHRPELHSFLSNVDNKVTIVGNDRTLTALFVNIDDSLSDHYKILRTVKQIFKEELAK